MRTEFKFFRAHAPDVLSLLSAQHTVGNSAGSTAATPARRRGRVSSSLPHTKQPARPRHTSSRRAFHSVCPARGSPAHSPRPTSEHVILSRAIAALSLERQKSTSAVHIRCSRCPCGGSLGRSGAVLLRAEAVAPPEIDDALTTAVPQQDRFRFRRRSAALRAAMVPAAPPAAAAVVWRS